MAGLDDLISALGNRMGSTLSGASPFQGAQDRLGALNPFQGGMQVQSPFRVGLAAESPFQGRGFNVQSPFGGTFNVQSPFRGILQGGTPFGGNPLGNNGIYNPFKPATPVASGNGTATSPGLSGTPSSGMSAGVAQWANQAKATFADLGDDMPDVMLAIMTNESGGDPNAKNPGYPAYGLFQLVGYGSNLTPDQQFASAHQLAQQKLASIENSYKAHGLNPDARTRTRDFALAWAGHFDYDTGLPNTSSKDIVSGQTAQQLSDIFLKNYDAIKAGRSSQPTGGNSGYGTQPGWNNSITPGVNGQIMQEFGHTDYSEAHPDTYAYGNAYGLEGSQHPGVDWAVPMGTRTTTPVGGTVIVVGNDHGSGYYYKNTMSASNPDTSGEFAIQLDNGDILILGHMSQINVRVGQRLNAGDFIGLSGGSDGAHIHVEYRKRDSTTGSGYRIVDPRAYIR